MMEELVTEVAADPQVVLPQEDANLSDAQRLVIESSIGPEVVNSRIAVVARDAVQGKLLSALEFGGYADLCPSPFGLAMSAIRKWSPDVVVLEMANAPPSGLDVLSAIRADGKLRELPVLAIVEDADAEMKSQAWKAGATEFISSCLDSFELVTRIGNVISVAQFKQHMLDHEKRLQEELGFRTLDLRSSNQQLVFCLARAAELRDDETGQHVRRVGAYSAWIAKQLGLDEQFVSRIELAAQLHDIGKLGVPDRILLKDSALDDSEQQTMQKHCAMGRKIVQESGDENARRAHADNGHALLGETDSELMQMAARIAQTHHEHWDGSGYPLGLTGQEIPIEGRITAVADAYDALSSTRPFRAALPRNECFDILRQQRGTQFDKKVVDVFLSDINAVIAIQIQFAD